MNSRDDFIVSSSLCDQESNVDYFTSPSINDGATILLCYIKPEAAILSLNKRVPVKNLPNRLPLKLMQMLSRHPRCKHYTDKTMTPQYYSSTQLN